MQLHYGNLIEKAKNGEFDVIIHGANCFHTMGAGIAKHIKSNFPEAFEADKKTGYGDKNKVGTFSQATVEHNGHKITIINAYTQYRFGNDRDQFEYDSFPSLLQEIKNQFGSKKIGIPLIGCGLAGGDEGRILKMIKENFEGLDYKLVEIDTNRKLNLGKEENPTLNKEEPQYTFFFSLTSPFSNFHPSKIEYKEYTFISNEQFMMFGKSKTFNDEAAAQKILAFNETPLAKSFLEGKISRQDIVNDKDMSDKWNKLMMQVKYTGRDVKNYDDKVWSDKREKIVAFGANLKFTQNEDLKQELMGTGKTLMVEAASRDKIWGIGLDEATAKKTDPAKWPGLNLLGKLLDNLKSKYTMQPSSKLKI